MTLALAPSPVRDASVDQAVSRLAEEFGHRCAPQVVVGVVQGCRQELSGAPVDALPELVERLARYRLHLAQA